MAAARQDILLGQARVEGMLAQIIGKQNQALAAAEQAEAAVQAISDLQVLSHCISTANCWGRHKYVNSTLYLHQQVRKIMTAEFGAISSESVCMLLLRLV